jgi:hypothetical protein
MAANGEEGVDLARKVKLALIIFRKDEFKIEDIFDGDWQIDQINLERHLTIPAH